MSPAVDLRRNARARSRPGRRSPSASASVGTPTRYALQRSGLVFPANRVRAWRVRACACLTCAYKDESEESEEEEEEEVIEVADDTDGEEVRRNPCPS